MEDDDDDNNDNNNNEKWENFKTIIKEQTPNGKRWKQRNLKKIVRGSDGLRALNGFLKEKQINFLI